MGTAPQPSIVTLPTLDPQPTLLDFLDDRFPQVGREVWRARLEAGKVKGEDGRAVGLESPYRAGARLFYLREVEKEPRIPFAETIVFRNDQLLVADKPPFLPVVPAGQFVEECLLYRLRRSTGIETLAPLHRLDRHTRGLVLFSLRSETRGRYGGLFVHGQIERTYRAVAHVPEPPAEHEWTVASRLVPGEPWFRMREVPGEPNSNTHVRLLDWRAGRGLFELSPATGKKHQLRLHLAKLGFPIVGDRLYPELLSEAPDDLNRSLELLASRLRFLDPVGGEKIDLESRQTLVWPPA